MPTCTKRPGKSSKTSVSTAARKRYVTAAWTFSTLPRKPLSFSKKFGFFWEKNLFFSFFLVFSLLFLFKKLLEKNKYREHRFELNLEIFSQQTCPSLAHYGVHLLFGHFLTAQAGLEWRHSNDQEYQSLGSR